MGFLIYLTNLGGKITSIVLDSVNEVVFWCDSFMNSIYIKDLNSRHYGLVFQDVENLNQTSALAVDPVNHGGCVLFNSLKSLSGNGITY